MYAKDRTTIIDRREMLKIKLISLADEARTIRRLAQRTHGQLRHEMNVHRKGVVGDAARATHLAYGFIRGRTLEQMESRRNVGLPPYLASQYDDRLFAEVRKMLKKYGPAGFVEPECMRGTLKAAA